jgi:cytochrome c oxidase subunit II
MPGGVRRRVLVAGTVVLGVSCAGLVLATTALAGNGGLLPPAAHSPNAHRIREAFVFILAFVLFVFAVVEGTLVALVLKYRRGRRARSADGLQVHGSTRLEILWTVVPVLILVAIGTFVFVKLPGIANAPAASAADETTITVEGHQFYWLFRYPNGAVSVGTMVAPAGDVVHEDVEAPAGDVLHSWWVPALGGKIDAIPGRTNHTWFKAPAGTYDARCSDLCGIQHAKMTATVEVVPRAQYEKFIDERAAEPAAEVLGQQEFQAVCSVCHRLATNYVGPALGSNPLLTDAKGLGAILRNGVGKMPAVGIDWTNEQIDALVAYTKTLKTKGSDGSTG